MTVPEAPAQFTRVRWRPGYDVAEVDRFVVRLLATLDGRPVDSPVTSDEVRNVAFSSSRFRGGYDVDEVDRFLDLAVGWLNGR
ncbi:DivIVA domain-containing protein [Kribbella sp. NPDC049174]|uniref:DivIVA domain-containing protein n=1 Tax=Kribbella sp. NPDC049174 TaxID=3364112 RepID=UPI00371106F2